MNFTALFYQLSWGPHVKKLSMRCSLLVVICVCVSVNVETRREERADRREAIACRRYCLPPVSSCSRPVSSSLSLPVPHSLIILAAHHHHSKVNGDPRTSLEPSFNPASNTRYSRAYCGRRWRHDAREDSRGVSNVQRHADKKKKRISKSPAISIEPTPKSPSKKCNTKSPSAT